MSRNIPSIQQAQFLYLSDHPDQHYEKISSVLKEGYNELDKYNIDANNIIKDSYLSRRNIDLIQKWTSMEVLKQTGIKIPYQNLQHVLDVANKIYITYGQNLPYGLKDQIYELNMKTVLHLSDTIVNELYARARYYKDIESANFIENPKYMGARGQRALPTTMKN